jgi:dual specificity tyrosine-phosphorylation-regulated kinase 2/3/4
MDSKTFFSKPLSEVPIQSTTVKLNPKALSNMSPSIAASSIQPNLKRIKPLVLSTTPRATIHILEKAKQLKSSESTKAAVKRVPIKTLLKSSTLEFPVTAAQVLSAFPDLPEWSKDELTFFDPIYFFNRSTKTFRQDFDDDKGDYKPIQGDDFLYRYELHEILGKGAFGTVIKAFDHQEKQMKALKIIKNNERFLQQAETEISILMHLRDLVFHDFLIKFDTSFTFRSHIVLVFEVLGINLYDLIKRNLFRGLSMPLIKKFTSQILEGLSSLNQLKIIHCDMKPENILVNDSSFSSVKIIDFGSSCFENNQIYSYIQSRFYRAPEIVLGVRNYSTSIDIWSFGCILVELYTGIPLFPAENEKELVCRMFELLGQPSADLLKGHRSHLFFDGAGKLKVETRRPGGKRNLKSVLKGAENGLVELVDACLKWSPDQRISPEEALRSSWLADSQAPEKKKLKISIDDITRHTPALKKFIAGRNNTLK